MHSQCSVPSLFVIVFHQRVVSLRQGFRRRQDFGGQVGGSCNGRWESQRANERDGKYGFWFHFVLESTAPRYGFATVIARPSLN